jgi:two-component system phosphate regulon response regulator OmpR
LAETANAANERTIDVQINRLRRKLEVDPSNPVHLQTVRGIGYRLVIER